MNRCHGRKQLEVPAQRLILELSVTVQRRRDFLRPGFLCLPLRLPPPFAPDLPGPTRACRLHLINKKRNMLL